MTLCFDGSCLADGPHTGVARAFLDTLAAFAPQVACKLLLPREVAVARLALHPSVDVVPGPRGFLHKQLAWPRLLRELHATLLHVPVAALPRSLPCPAVITVHDLPWRARLPLPAAERWRWRHRVALRASARRAAAILVPSPATAADLRGELGAAVSAAIHVVPHGHPPVAPAPLDDLRGPLLALGDDRPRKNRARVARAHALARARCPDLPDLLFLGPPDHYVSEADKDTALRRATGLVHASLHEGFGLPLLEAMARGVPVLASDVGGLRELVADGAAEVVDPLDESGIADGMLRLCRDQALRARLRERGLARAGQFPCTATAAHWRRIHDQVLRAPAPRPA